MRATAAMLNEITIPNTTKPPTTPPTIAAMLDQLSKRTKGDSMCVYVHACVCMGVYMDV